MAGKSAMPLLLGVGAAALLLGGTKKKKTSAAKSGNGGEEPEDLPPVNWLEVTTDAGGDERLALDAECAQIANKINMPDHNEWLTNRYYQLYSEGMTDLGQLTVQLLKDQSEHCPWGDPTAWTGLMKSLYEQLLVGVKGWHEQTGGVTAQG